MAHEPHQPQDVSDVPAKVTPFVEVCKHSLLLFLHWGKTGSEGYCPKTTLRAKKNLLFEKHHFTKPLLTAISCLQYLVWNLAIISSAMINDSCSLVSGYLGINFS